MKLNTKMEVSKHAECNPTYHEKSRRINQPTRLEDSNITSGNEGETIKLQQEKKRRRKRQCITYGKAGKRWRWKTGGAFCFCNCPNCCSLFQLWSFDAMVVCSMKVQNLARID